MGFVYRGEDVMTAQPNHYDGRYWVMWKLPMFGCTDPRQVLEEVRACTTEYPNAYVRVIGFDSTRQVQCLSFIVHKPGMPPARRRWLFGPASSSSAALLVVNTEWRRAVLERAIPPTCCQLWQLAATLVTGAR